MVAGVLPVTGDGVAEIDEAPEQFVCADDVE
jgi:hypothetical protein